MQYVIAFLEGIITFISPCLLPMLPIYISYFAAGPVRTPRRTALTCLGFVCGFSSVFVALGALAGSVGSLLQQHQTIVDLVCGGIVILFGLNYLGVFQLAFFRGRNHAVDNSGMSFFSAMIFGVVFSISWTPCVGVFLGSALMLASQQGHMMQGVLMLLAYSLGLGIPFMLSAFLLDSLRSALQWIRSHYTIINRICGVLLIIVGIFMATGSMNQLLGIMQ